MQGGTLMKRKSAPREKKRTAYQWDDVRVSGSGTLYIEPGDVLRRRVRAVLQKRREKKAETAV